MAAIHSSGTDAKPVAKPVPFKRKNRGKPERDEDEKLLHQATVAASREAKAVKAFFFLIFPKFN